MKFLDLFAGIGGFRRGLERSGHTCVGHVEIDQYANKSYMAMYELAPCPCRDGTGSNFCMMCKQEVRKNCEGTTLQNGGNPPCEWYAKDIKQIRAGEIPKAEIWTFGFPCTDISISNNKQLGLDGGRSGLFFEVARLLQGKGAQDRPEWIIVENVKNLLSIKRGGDFTAVLFELSELGYDLEWGCVNSKNFYVPQNRERVYIIGHLRRISGRKIFPLGGTNPAPVRQILDGSQGNRVYDPGGVSVTMVAEAGGFGGKTGLYAMPVKHRDSAAKALTVLSVQNSHATGIVCVGNTNPSGNGMNGNVYSTQGLSPTLTTNKGEGLKVTVSAQIPPCAAFIDMNRCAELTEDARCLKARYHSGIGNHRGETSGVFICQGHPDCVRAVITPNRLNKRQNGRRMKEPGEPSFCLTTQDQHGILLCCCDGGLPIRSDTKAGHTIAHHGDSINLTYPNSTARRGRVGKQCAQTLLTSGSMGVLLCCRIRRLTPKEAWRLQSFEDYLFERARAAGISDAQLYRQAGNAVTVNIVYEIGARLPGGAYEI